MHAHQRILGQDVPSRCLEQLLLGRARFQRQFGVARVEFEEVTVRPTGPRAAPSLADAFETRDALPRAIAQRRAPR